MMGMSPPAEVQPTVHVWTPEPVEEFQSSGESESSDDNQVSLRSWRECAEEVQRELLVKFEAWNRQHKIPKAVPQCLKEEG